MKSLVLLTLLPSCSENVDKTRIQAHLRLVLYGAAFEGIGMYQSPKDFEKSDKLALTRSLWMAKREDIEGLRLICRLYIDYDLSDHVILHNAIEGLQKLKDIEFLFGILERDLNIDHKVISESVMLGFQIWWDGKKEIEWLMRCIGLVTLMNTKQLSADAKNFLLPCLADADTKVGASILVGIYMLGFRLDCAKGIQQDNMAEILEILDNSRYCEVRDEIRELVCNDRI